MTRRIAREKAFQTLFQIEVGRIKTEDALVAVFDEGDLTQKDLNYLRQVVLGTITNLAEIDKYIGRNTHAWDLDRLANVDKTLLRLATYEMLYLPEVPRIVSINEAVELSKTYNSEEAGKFVNGLLDKIRLELEAATKGKDPSV
ncbi:MAG: transcription antitermination factor NusB [Bacillota bacterium]